MKNITLYTLTIMLLLVLTACPYSSNVPISEANLKIDNSLIGKWIDSKDIKKDHPNYFQISDNGNNHFKIGKFDYNSSDSTYKELVYIAHISKIDNNSFLNMQMDGEGDFYLYKIELTGNRFKLFEITDNIDEKFSKSDELKNFIKKYMHLSFFYNKDEKLYVRE